MKKLEVGQSFEVVEVIKNDDYFNEFKIGGFTIKSVGNRFNHTLANGIDWYRGFEKEDLLYNHGLFLQSHEIKPVGRLIIKSVK